MAARLQLTLALIKPDAVCVPYALNNINEKLLHNNFLIIKNSRMKLSLSDSQTFYQEHKGKFFFNRLVKYMSSGELVAMILAREDAVQQWRQVMGPTQVYRARYTHPTSLRGLWGLTDTRNSAHGSDSEPTASREMKFFFPDFDASDWCDRCLPRYQRGEYTFNEKLLLHELT